MKEPQFAAKKNILSVTHDAYEFQYDTSNGTFGITPRAVDAAISGACAKAVFFTSGTEATASSSAASARKHSTAKSGKDMILSVVNEFQSGATLTQEFKFFADASRIYSRAVFTAPKSSSAELDFIRPLDVTTDSGIKAGASLADWSIYNLGYQSWTPAEAIKINERPQRPNFSIPHIVCFNPLRYPPRIRGHHFCDWFTVIKNTASADSIVCGFVTMKDMFSHFYLEAGLKDNKLREFNAHCCGDRVLLDAGASFPSEWLYIDFTKNPLAAMDEYADAVRAGMNARMPEEIPVGWCSWYKYFTKIEQGEMMSNLKALEKLSADIPIKFYQIDDGYQSAVGDWKTLRGNRFPDGMGHMAKESRAAGFEPGIWVAPFFARKNSRLYKEHRDWFLKDKRGKPILGGFNPLWGGGLSPLDLTNPQVQDWLRDIFKTVVHDWGYKYLKLDFLYSACLPGERHDQRVTRAQAYRRGLEIIREVAGDDAFILGCGAPLGPSIGVVEAMRIGTDVGPKWRDTLLRAFLGPRTEPSVESSLLNCVTRSFLHGRFWANDPDCILLRKGKLSHDEYLTFSTVIGLTGGMLLISDNMNELDDEGRHVFGQLVPPTGVPAVPVDLFENRNPSVYCLNMPGKDKIKLVAAINWNDSPSGVSVDFSSLGLNPDAGRHVFDFWQEKHLGILHQGISFPSIPAHACRFLVLREESGEPAVLASNLHISAGTFEIKKEKFDKNTNRLELSLSLPGKRKGKIFIHSPKGFSPVSAKQDGAEVRMTEISDGVHAIELSFSGAAEVAVEFNRK